MSKSGKKQKSDISLWKIVDFSQFLKRPVDKRNHKELNNHASGQWCDSRLCAQFLSGPPDLFSLDTLQAKWGFRSKSPYFAILRWKNGKNLTFSLNFRQMIHCVKCLQASDESSSISDCLDTKLYVVFISLLWARTSFVTCQNPFLLFFHLVCDT